MYNGPNAADLQSGWQYRIRFLPLPYDSFVVGTARASI